MAYRTDSIRNIALTGNSGGDGNFTMAFSHYTQVEEGLQGELTTSFKPTDDE